MIDFSQAVLGTSLAVSCVSFLVAIGARVRIQDEASLIDFQQTEINLLTDKLQTVEFTLNQFLAGHINATEKPERTPGMP